MKLIAQLWDNYQFYSTAQDKCPINIQISEFGFRKVFGEAVSTLQVLTQHWRDLNKDVYLSLNLRKVLYNVSRKQPIHILEFKTGSDDKSIGLC